MKDTDFTDDNLLTNEVKIYLGMLRAVILNWLVEIHTVLTLSWEKRVVRRRGKCGAPRAGVATLELEWEITF
jgi:hypothetical protein